MAPQLRKLPGGGGRTRIHAPHTTFLNYEEGDRVKSLMRSLYVLDKWLEDNGGQIEDEVRLRRVKHWREEALQQLRLELNFTRL
jgi:hypothetical protein